MNRSLRLLAAITLGALAIACTATDVHTNTAEAGPYAPANEAAADGEVAYLNAGARTVRDSRRQDAYKKMHDHCGGAYEIVKEEDQESPFGPQRRIWFRCIAAGPGQG